MSIRRTSAALFLLPALLLGACSDQTPAAPGPNPPVSTPIEYMLTVSDGGTALTSGRSQYDFQNGSAHTFAVAESNYAGAFIATSSNTAVATVSITGGVLTVTPKTTAGFSTITVSDSLGQSFTFTVSVTTASLVLN